MSRAKYHPHVWTDREISTLRQSWSEGKTASDIGEQLHMTKNAIVGKAHRLELDARPYPIKRAASPKQPKPEKAPSVTLPALASDTPTERAAIVARHIAPVRAPIAPSAISNAPAHAPAPRIEPSAPIPYQAPVVVSVEQMPRTARMCCWPTSPHGSKTFIFCEEPSVPQKPYCAEHMALGTVRVKARADDERSGT